MSTPQTTGLNQMQGGTTCGLCGGWVPTNTAHFCPTVGFPANQWPSDVTVTPNWVVPSAPLPDPQIIGELRAIRELLEKLLAERK